MSETTTTTGTTTTTRTEAPTTMPDKDISMAAVPPPTGRKPQGPLPLLIGVTGHRDLREEDLPILETRVGEILADLAARFPHTPVEVLSPLAEGADRLVARAALAQGMRL